MRSWGETGEGHLNLISVNDKELGGKPTLSEEKKTHSKILVSTCMA